MSTVPELMRRAREATAAHPMAVARVKARALRTAAVTERLFDGVRDPHPAAVARVRGRLLTERRPPSRAWLVPSVAALAAAALVALGWPQDDALPALELGPRQVLQLTPEVRLDVTGVGASEGSRFAPAVAWDRGRLSVDVTPERGVDLVVQTPEAEVRVVGTVFDVERDALGTHVTVVHGKVQVGCVDGDTRLLTAEETLTCAPVRPGGLLGRAQALLDLGRVDEAEAALEAGLREATGEIRGELLATRLRLLVTEGRREEARAVARTYVDEGHRSRAAEVGEVLERLGAGR